MFSIKDYQFNLPSELIAHTAAHPAPSAKMLVFSGDQNAIIHEGNFYDIPKFLDENSVIFLNNSKVIKARIPLVDTKITKIDGTETIVKNGEIFYLKSAWEWRFEALVRPGKKFKIGSKLSLNGAKLTVVDVTDTGRIFEISGKNIFDLMEDCGTLPLPPYIEYSKEKEVDYQSVFADKIGSVAAPTASLHFDDELLASIPNEKCFVTLHIGLGTFKTIDTDDIRSYDIHEETSEVMLSIFDKITQIKNTGRTIVAIGTTTCRTLESLPSLWKNLKNQEKAHFDEMVQKFWDKISENSDVSWIPSYTIHENSVQFQTKAYITPGYTFRIIDDLVTNFHLPESSLLVLVSALIGQENMKNIYAHAIRNNYRFFSFGDGMLLKKH